MIKLNHNIIFGILLILFGLIWYVVNPFNQKPSLSNISVITVNGEMPLNEYFDEKTIIYFGYVSCPLICPMTMSRLSELFKQYDQNDTTVVFISLSPQDDFAKTHRYAQLYHPNMVGVDVSEEDLEQLTAWLKVQYRDLENGEINHSGNLYLFRQQELVKVLPFGVETETIVQALKRI